MVHIVWIYLARIIGVGCVVVAYLFYLHSRISVQQLELKRGELVENPIVATAQVSGKPATMKLHLLNEEMPLTIPGVLLQLADPQITQLKKGDTIRFYEKSKQHQNVLDKIRRLAYSVGDEHTFYLTRETAIGHYKGKNHMMQIYLSIVVGLIAFLLSWKLK